ncbi:hypothetical protein AK88_00099 [Plasmodium fragile]|uniref:Uncharacterized protein n=1 Tax=Plasmodium fragile TaxID=5857 RepID=A0A0D9QUE2_PLAFR|nr:uncharacterized protein AK88_00099 [Plasmodium fragile]KJP90251.1 hypothetical protein AK88_00099 [Plasmodium fragile]
MVDNEYHDVHDTSHGVNPLDCIGKRAANWNSRGDLKTKSDATHGSSRRHTVEMKGTTSRSESINLYNNITDSLSKLKTIIKYDQEHDVDKGGGETQQGKAHEIDHCKLATDGPNDAAKYPFMGGSETADGGPTHRQRDERKTQRTKNNERELLKSIAKANSLRKIEKNISLLLRSDDEEEEVEEEKEDQHLKDMKHLKQPQQHYDESDGCVAVAHGSVFTPGRYYHQREGYLPNQPYPSSVHTDGHIKNKNCDEAVEMDRDVNYRVHANYNMGGNLDSLERIPHFSRTGSRDKIGHAKHLIQSGYGDMVDTDMAIYANGPVGKNQFDLSFISTEDLKKEFSFYSLSEKNSVHKFSLQNNDMLDLSQVSNFSNFSNGLRGSSRSNFAKGSKPKEATMSDSNTSISSFTFNGNSSNLIGRDLAEEDESDRRDDHGEHGINRAINLNNDHCARVHDRVFSTAANCMENKGLKGTKKSDMYIAMDNTSSNSGTYYENSLKSNRSNLGTSRQNTLDESHRTYLGSGDYFDPSLSHTKVDKNAVPGHVIFHTKNNELNEALHNLNVKKKNSNGNSSWVKSGEAAPLKSSGVFVNKNYLNISSSNDRVDLARSQMSVTEKGMTIDHMRDGGREKRKESVHVGSNIDFDNNIFKNYNKEKKLEEGSKKCGSDVEGLLGSEEGMSQVLTHAASSSKAALKDEVDCTLPISEDDMDRKNINEIYKKINSISMLNDLSLNKLESLNSSIMDIYTKNNDEGKFLDDVILDDSIFIKSNSVYREEDSPHIATLHGDIPPDDYRKRFSFSSDPDAADSLFKISLSCNEVVLPTGETGSTHNNRPDAEKAKKEQQQTSISGPTPSSQSQLEATHCEIKQRAELREPSTFKETTKEDFERRTNSINQLKDKYSKRKDETMEKDTKLCELPSQLDKNMLLKNTLTLQRSYNNMEWRKAKTVTLDQFATPSSDLLPNENDQMAKGSISRSSVNKTDNINRFSNQDMYVHEDKLSRHELDNLPNVFLSKNVFAKNSDLVSKPSGMNTTLGKGYEDALPSREYDIRSEANNFSISNYSSLTGKGKRNGDQINQANSFSSAFLHDDKASNGDPSHSYRGGTSGGMRRKRSISDCEGESANVYNDSSVERIQCDNANGPVDSSAYDVQEVKWTSGGAGSGADGTVGCTDGECTGGRHNVFIGASRSSMRGSLRSRGKMEWNILDEANGSKTKERRGSSEESIGVPNDLGISKRASHGGVNNVSNAYPDEEISTCAEEGARFTPHTNEDTNHMRNNLSYDAALINGNLEQSQNGKNPRFLRQINRESDSEKLSSLVTCTGKEVQLNESKLCALHKKSTLEEGKAPSMVNNKSIEGINYASQCSKEDEIKHSGMTSLPDILHFGENNNSSIFFFDNIHNSSEYDCIPKPLHSSYFENKRKVSRDEGEVIEEGKTTCQSNGNAFERITKRNVSRTLPPSEVNPLIAQSSMNESARYPSGENEKHFEQDIMRQGKAQRQVSKEGVPARQGSLTKKTPSWKRLQRSSSSSLFSGPTGEIKTAGGFPDNVTRKENTHEDHRRSSVGAIFVKENVQQKGPIDPNTTSRREGTNQRSIDQVQPRNGVEASEKGRAKAKSESEAANDILETCSTSYSFEKCEINEQKGQTRKPYQYVPQEDYKICEPQRRGSRNVATEYDSTYVGGANEEKRITRKVSIPPSEEKRKVRPNCYDEGHNSPFAHGEEKIGNGGADKKGSRNGSPPRRMPNDVHTNTEIHQEHQRMDSEKVVSKENVSGHTHPCSGRNRDDHLDPIHFNKQPSVDYQLVQGPGRKETDYMEGNNHEETFTRNTQYSKNSNDPYGDPYRCKSGQSDYVKEGGYCYEHVGDEREKFLPKSKENNYTSHKGNMGDYPYGKYCSKGKRENEFYSNHYNEVRSNGEYSKSGALIEDAYVGAVNVEQNKTEARGGRGMHHRGDKDVHGDGFQSERNPLGDKNSFERIDSLNTIQPYGMNHPREDEAKMNTRMCGNGRGTHPSDIHTEGGHRRNTKDIVVKRINETIMTPDRLHKRTDSTKLERTKDRNTYDHAGEDFSQERPTQDYPYGRCQSRDANYPHEQTRKGETSRRRDNVEMISTNPYQLKKNEQFETSMIQHKYSKNGTQRYEHETHQPIYPFMELLPHDKVHSGNLGSLVREEEFVNRLIEENVCEKYSALGGCEGYEEKWPQREGVSGDRGNERYGPSWSRGADYHYGGLCREHHGEKHYEEKHYEEKHYGSYPTPYENFAAHSVMGGPFNKVEKSKTSVKIVDHNYASSGAPYGPDFEAVVMQKGAYVKAHTSYVAYAGGDKWKGNSMQPLGYAHLEENKEAIYNYKGAHLKYDMKGEMYEGKHMGTPHEYGQCLRVDGRNNTTLPYDYYLDGGAQRCSKYAQEELHRQGENVIKFPRVGESKDVDVHMDRVAPAPSCHYGSMRSGNDAGSVPLHYEMKREDNTNGLVPQMGDNHTKENKAWTYREGKIELPFRKANTNYEHYKVLRDMGSNGDGHIFRHSEGDTVDRGGMSRGHFHADHNINTSSGRNAHYNELLYELFKENRDNQGKEKNSKVLNKIMDVMINIQNDLKDVKCKLSKQKKKSDPPEEGGDAQSEDSGQRNSKSKEQPNGQHEGQCNNRENNGKRGGENNTQSNCLDKDPARRCSPLSNPEQDASLIPVLKNLNYEDVKDSAMSKSNRLYLFSKFFTSVFYEHSVKTHNFIMFNIYNTEQKRQTHKVSLFLERDYNDIYSVAYNNLLFYSFDCYTFYKYIKSKFQGSYKIYENSTLCLYIQNNYETNLINRLFIEQNNLHKSTFCLNEKRILKTCTKYVVESFLSLLDKQVNIKNVIPFMKKRNYEIDQRNLYFFISRFNLMDKIFSDSHGFECNKKAFEKSAPNVRNFAVFFKYIRDASNFYDSLVGEETEEACIAQGSAAHSTNAAAAAGTSPSSRSYRLIIVALHKGKSFHYDKAPFSSFINSKQSDMQHYYNNYDSMSFSNDEVVLFNLSYAVPFYYIEYYRN